ncbi:hypothetical protein HYC85_022955, partial [Camellia sinensis]
VGIRGLCQGCNQIVWTRNTYKCLKFGCWFHIHKPCAQLPQQLSHPFHPQHPLTLLPHPPFNRDEFRCQACGKTRRGFTFHCSTCQFNIDINCASLKPQINQQISIQHFNHTNLHTLDLCIKDKDFDVFCSACESQLQDHDTIYGRRHRHQLTLTYSPIRDHPDEDEAAELYCDDYKKLRYLIDPTYYCKECHYVAHVECMISKEDVSLLGEESVVVGQHRDMGLESSEQSG